jgi:hypothetical protein
MASSSGGKAVEDVLDAVRQCFDSPREAVRREFACAVVLEVEGSEGDHKRFRTFVH